MRILFVSPVGAFFSGAEVAIVNLMTHLAKEGHQIINVIPDNETNRDDVYLSTMQEAGVVVYQLPYLKWWWSESSELTAIEKNSVAVYQHQNIKDIRTFIKRHRIELVISNTANVFQGALASAFEQVPHYHIIHEFPHGQFNYYKTKIPIIDALADKVFTVDGSLYEELKGYFPKDKLVPFIPYTDIVESKLLVGQHPRIVCVGGIQKGKNQLELIKAYHYLGKENLELVLIGSWDDSYKKLCDDYIEKNGLTNITFLGYQENPWQFVTDQDIVVIPSKQETFGLVFAEAVLNGLPTIVSDNEGHQLVKQTLSAGEVYQLGDVTALSTLIENVLNQFSEYKLQAKQAKVKAREAYNLEACLFPFLQELSCGEIGDFSNKLSEVASVFDFSLSREILEEIKGQKITIFFADSEGHFMVQNSVEKFLRDADSFEIKVTNNSQIRIDLSENPGIFTEVKLVSKRYKTQLVPVYMNALEESDNLLFYERDPLLIYDTRYHQDDTLVFSYKKLETFSLGKMLKGVIDRNKAITIQKENDYSRLREEYQQLHHNHQAVINSRRWTLTTKLINFFRRK